MNSRLLYILLAQVIAIILWGCYVHHRTARLEYLAEENLVRGFNVGVDSMVVQTRVAGLIRTDEQMNALHHEQETLRKKNGSWVGLEDHMAVSLLAIPAGALSALVLITLLLEARSGRRMSNRANARQQIHSKAVDF